MADNGNPPKKNAAASIAFAWGKQTALQGTTSRKWTSSIEVNSALSLVLSTIIGKKLTISSAQICLSVEAFRFHSVKKICMVLFPDKHKTVGRPVLEPQLKCQAATSWGLRPHP